MDIAALKAELAAGHPGGVSGTPVPAAYSTDAETAAAQLNAVNRQRPRATMTGSEVFNAIALPEWDGLDVVEQRQIWDVVHMHAINPYGREADIFRGVFTDAESPTIAALQAARQEPVSRATEIDLGHVRPGNVTEARK